MKLVAGIDIGNATTELAITEHHRGEAVVRHVARAPTRGHKGSLESLEAAARLLDRVERRLGARCVRVAIAELRPVQSLLIELPSRDTTLLPLASLTPASAGTPGGRGFAVGQHHSVDDLESPPKDVPVVVSVPDHIAFEAAAEKINAFSAAGRNVVAVLAEADEGVLIANRLDDRVPVVDEAAVAGLSMGQTIAVEVAEEGRTVARVTDIFTLADAFGVSPDAELSRFTEGLRDSRAVAVVKGTAQGCHADSDWWVEIADGNGLSKVPLAEPMGPLAEIIRPGSVRRIRVPLAGNEGEHDVLESSASDFFAPSLAEIQVSSFARSGTWGLAEVPAAFMTEDPENCDPQSALEELVNRPVVSVGDEAEFARRGALTTPGTPRNAIVCDMGAGTLDVAADDRSTVVAGAGHLVTLAVSNALRIAVSLAEHAKRGDSLLVESPGLVRYENGRRGFFKSTAPTDIGCLCYRAGRALTPFAREVSPEEWRIIRLAIKARVLGDNIKRCLSEFGAEGSVLLLCGGGALDVEAVRVVSSVFGRGPVSVGRANVAGRYGPRYAAAVGLASAG